MYNIKYILTHPKQDYDVCVSQKRLLHWLLEGWTINLPDTKLQFRYFNDSMNEIDIEYN